MAKSRRNEKKLQAKIKMSKKHLKTITKKVAKPVQETPMEIDNPVVAAPKESRTSLKKGKKIAKRSMNAALHLPNTTRAEEDHEKEKKLPKVNENRLRLHQMPLFLNPKAKNLKNITPDMFSQTVVAPTRRVSKKKFKKMLKRKEKLEKQEKDKQEAASKKMDTT